MPQAAVGIDAVLEEMRAHFKLHAGSENLQRKWCTQLANLAADNAYRQGKIGEQGGIELVLEAMRRHASVPNVQKSSALTCKSGRAKVASADVQKSCCKALANLAADNAENQGKIGAQGGMWLLLEAMRRRAGSADLQLSCCRTLASLARGIAENKGKIGAQGGIELLLKAMRMHAGRADVQKWCCEALASLAADNAENQGKIGAQGGIELLLKAMRMHAGSADVQKSCGKALENLASSDASAPALSAGAGAAAGSHRSGNAETDRKVRIMCVGAG
jgi:predicted hotdog family 3-hydroxylacyl-ACP dehydratase